MTDQHQFLPSPVPMYVRSDRLGAQYCPIIGWSVQEGYVPVPITPFGVHTDEGCRIVAMSINGDWQEIELIDNSLSFKPATA